MPYYAYIAHNENRSADEPSWRVPRQPIAYIDFVKGRKEGKARLARLLARHPELPKDGWGRITHRKLDTEDNAVIEKMKQDIRLKLSSLAITSHGERRLWADKPGALAGCYRLDYWEANKVLRDALDRSGLYKPG